MNTEERVKSILEWGKGINSLSQGDWEALFERAANKNRWFTKTSCQHALQGILRWFQPDTFREWASHYHFSEGNSSQKVGLVMAGNIPLVGFHDFLCVLLAGHQAKVKLSSQDDELLPYLTSLLVLVDERWSQRFSFEDRLNQVDAVIATGSDNSSRYFEYYFNHIPRIIRKNRTSVAVIMGEENPEEFKALGLDVFTYFGLGCRNVSKIFIPQGFDPETLSEAFKDFEAIINHNKYANNYDYQRAIRLVSSKPFIDTGILLLEQSPELVSPIAVLYYETYSSLEHLNEMLTRNENKIQCVVSAKGWFKGSIAFGEAQTPRVNDYADNIDTMKFLESI